MERLDIPFDGYTIFASVGGEGDRCLACINAAQMTMAAFLQRRSSRFVRFTEALDRDQLGS